jgi:hypothetical protein
VHARLEIADTLDAGVHFSANGGQSIRSSSRGTAHMLQAIFIILLLVLVPTHARAEEKIALLIGNEAYGRLSNPHNDVGLLEGVLKGLHFEVAVVQDAGLGAHACS